MGGEGSPQQVKSIDSNVLLPVTNQDDPVQSPTAAAVLGKPVFISHGVIMEKEWVLRSHHRWPRLRIARAFKLLLEVRTIHLLEPDLLLWCFNRYEAGADLTDMLHIVASKDFEAFLSFESKLAQIAGPDAPVPVERLA